MKLSQCTKAVVLCLFFIILICPFAQGTHKSKSVVTTGAQPFEIDEEFKSEFKYFDIQAEKLKLKEEKKNLKVEKNHKKLIKKKKKLEQKRQKSTDNVQKYTDYKEKLENSFLPHSEVSK